MKKFPGLLFLVLTMSIVNGQNTSGLFVPKEIKKTYSNKTRSISGAPGDKYWQNKAVYTINAELFPEAQSLVGNETILYINNSPDTIKRLIFNILQDIFKKGTSRDWDIGPEDIHNGVEINKLTINGKEIDLTGSNVVRNATILGIGLESPLLPKSEMAIQIEWKIRIPSRRTIRMGTYNNDQFMVAYWFPRVAVYDDIVGWNTVPYVGNCEFYNDFSDFNVNLTLPSTYMVWSTGILQNAGDIFNKEILDRIENANNSDSVIHIISKGDWENDKIFKLTGKRVWRFKIDNVVDFAFAASSRYLWDRTSTLSGNRRVFVNAVYDAASMEFYQVCKIAQDAIDFFTNDSPGIDYPFSQLTVFNGRGGMEYPGMVNDGNIKDYNGTLYVTAHEIGHGYFPFAMGTNEQRYAWMDEGIINYIPRKFVAKYTKDTDYVLFKDIIEKYNLLAGTYSELPLILPSTNTGQSYRFQAYDQPSMAMMELEKYLGTDTFNMGLQLFAKRWKGKHPMPYDFFNTFNQVSGQNLNWFWKPWFFEMSYADLSLKMIEKKSFEIHNSGGSPVQVRVNIKFEDGSEDFLTFKADSWKDGKSSIFVQFDDKILKSVQIDTLSTPDANLDDNSWTE